MSNFHLLFGVGSDGSALRSELGLTLQATQLLQDQRGRIEELIGEFAKEHLGCVLVPRTDAQKTALALTFYPPSERDVINWTEPLFDSEGWAHALIHLGAVEVVTKHSFTYVTWDRRTGACKREGCFDLVIGNKEMTSEERQVRRLAGEKIMEAWSLRSGVIDIILPVLMQAPSLTVQREIQVRSELVSPSGMSQLVYLELQAFLEAQGLMAAQGRYVADDHHGVMTGVDALMTASPWTLHPDYGCVLKSDLEALERLEGVRERSRGG